METEKKFIRVHKSLNAIIYLKSLGFDMDKSCDNIINDVLRIDVEEKKVVGTYPVVKDETILTYQELLLVLVSLSNDDITNKFWKPFKVETGSYEEKVEEKKEEPEDKDEEQKKIVLDLIKDCAFPIKVELEKENGTKVEEIFAKGLSKREYIATSLLSGMLGNDNIARSRAVVEAVKLTDLLLAELRKPVAPILPEVIPERTNPKFQIDEDDY